MVARLYSAGPKNPFVIEAHLILFRSVNAIQPKFSAIQCEGVAVLYNQIEGPTWANQQQKNNREACAHGSRTIAVIMLSRYGWMLCWRIVFSTFPQCMSFYTAALKRPSARPLEGP